MGVRFVQAWRVSWNVEKQRKKEREWDRGTWNQTPQYLKQGISSRNLCSIGSFIPSLFEHQSAAMPSSINFPRAFSSHKSCESLTCVEVFPKAPVSNLRCYSNRVSVQLSPIRPAPTTLSTPVHTLTSSHQPRLQNLTTQGKIPKIKKGSLLTSKCG